MILLHRIAVVGSLVLIGACEPADEEASSDSLVALPEFSPGFLENLACAHLGWGQKLSVNPLTLPPGKTLNIAARETRRTTQSERQVMVQKHLFECQADALAAIGEAIGGLPTAALRDLAARRFLMARDLWEATANIRYAAEVEATFAARASRTYLINDQHYVWTYPKNGTLLLRSILADLDRHGVPVALRPDLRTMLTVNLSMEGQPTIVGDKDFVSNRTTFWGGPLTDEATIDALTSLSDLHAEAGAAGICVASGRTACPDVEALNAEVKRAEIAALRDFGIPVISPYSTGAAAGTTFESRCVSVQRAHLAYHAWMTNVLEGDTVTGFQDAWRAMFAHSIIHMNRRAGISFPGVLPGNPRVPASVMGFVEAPVPGVVAGVCDPFAGTGHTH